MSQYSISLKSIINIKSHFNNNDDVFANTKKKIERGREIFFDFDYSGDNVFKELFENKFVINYLTENIYCLDVDLFLLALENEVKIKSPIFYERYKRLEELKNNALDFAERTKSTRTLNEEHSANSSNQGTAKSTTTGDSSGENKTKSSQFPQDIVNSTNFDSINYMDGGSASKTSSKSTGTNNSSNQNTATENRQDKHIENFESERIINPLENIEKYINAQQDVITDFVYSLSNLFMKIW